jgi:hypothetical protein
LTIPNIPTILSHNIKQQLGDMIMKNWLASNSPAIIALAGALIVAVINNLFIGKKFKKLTSNHFHGLGAYLRILNGVLKRKELIDDKELAELNQKAGDIGTM